MIHNILIKDNSILRETEELLRSVPNRYHMVLQVVQRAKRKRYEEFNLVTGIETKPVIRAIREMVNETCKNQETI